MGKINKFLQAVGRLEDNVQVAEERSFEDNCEILRTIFLAKGIIVQYTSELERRLIIL